MCARERDLLRRLTARKAEIAADPTNHERRALWLRHDAGGGGRPMVLAEVGGVMNEVLPDERLECRDPWARGQERRLRMEIYQFDVLRDDHVIEPFMDMNWSIRVGDYGVQPVQHRPDNDGKLGARRWDAPIEDLDRDFARLRHRTFAVDREATAAEQARMEAVFGDILPVRRRGGFWWTFGLTMPAIDLIGLQNLMLFMLDNPEGLHRLMAFLRDDHLAFAEWAEREGLLNLNNGNDYIGSGSMGYTRRLPAPGGPPDGPARLKDLWILSESQETVGVGPVQFEEFIFPYQASLVERFGPCYYGCCEPVHTRIHILKRLPNLDRVSVSPWADQEIMARELGAGIVFSRKPNPSMISTEIFNEDAIRADLERTLAVARGCRVELIMKDVHTLNNRPERLPRWVELARRAGGDGG